MVKWQHCKKSGYFTIVSAGRAAETHRDMAVCVALQSTSQVKHLGFQALQDLHTEMDYQLRVFTDNFIESKITQNLTMDD